MKLGMNREEVKGFLGAPDDVGGTSRKYPEPSIWKYGDIELHFDLGGADALFLIHCDDFGVPSGGRSIDLDPWIIRRTLSPPEAAKHLSDSGIYYRMEESEPDGGKCITAGVGVRLIFIGDNLSLSAVSYLASAS